MFFNQQSSIQNHQVDFSFLISQDDFIRRILVSVQHVIHHHHVHHDYSPEREEYHRSLTPPPPRYSRREEFERSRRSPTIDEHLDARLGRVRDELRQSYSQKRDQSTETIDYYHPPPRPPSPITYKQHYDAPKFRPRSRSRSASLPR